jgi:DNA topoisomerase-1
MKLLPPEAAAKAVGLRYVCDKDAGIGRVRAGKGFKYILPGGKVLRDWDELSRIRALAIPPAWTDVWICTSGDGHIQATGVDAKGRKQYRYHAQWTAHRNLSKFESLAQFGSALSALRQRVDRDMKKPGMPREKVAACVVHLMDETYIRIGNAEYARDNGSYGLATMRNKHARVKGSEVRFSFKAKSGRPCEVSVESPAAAKIVRTCQDLPGQELFCYIDAEGVTRDIGSGDINAYLREATGQEFTAKDFRTWAGTCAAAEALMREGPPEFQGKPLNQRQLKRREVAAVKAAAEALNNTVSVCRKFYVHPELVAAYADGRLAAAFRKAAGVRLARMSVAERAVLQLFKAAAGRKRAA